MTSNHRLARLVSPMLGCLTILALALTMTRPLAADTALDVLREAPKPRFRPEHTLPPLTRWGWTMPYDVRVELAEHWGYALEFGAVSQRAAAQLDNPESVPSKLCTLAASNPQRYPLSVVTVRPLLSKVYRASLPDEAWCRDAEGTIIDEPRRAFSPEAPDCIFKDVGGRAAEPLRRIGKEAPIALVLNGGEYGLGVFGFCGEVWAKDPRVVEAKGDDASWFEYISRCKARQELLISRAARLAVPDRQLYLYYPTSGCPHRNRTAGWWKWAFDYRFMKPVSDIPNGESYYRHFNDGWTGGNDMLTQALNSVGYQIALGEPLSYNWLCAGWTRKDMGERAFADPEHYMGFLKCYYTAGMIGGVAGYFAYPPGGFKADFGPQPPSWLEQMLVLARAHALFSHHENLIRGGELVAGPMKHRWSKERPAYELPTGEADARVVARQHRQRPEWLVTAWAAGGDDRDVEVEVPELGNVRLRARACGSVYRLTRKEGRPQLDWLDRNGMYPTAAE